MDLLLWRHAEAEDARPDGSDLARRLTAKGDRQAAAMGRWLNRNLPPETKILVSPAVRTQQTAQALGRPFATVSAIAPGASPDALLKAAGWPDGTYGETVLLVGHQPTLGLLAARLITGTPAAWSVKKGAVWWLQYRARRGHDETVLKLVLPAELA